MSFSKLKSFQVKVLMIDEEDHVQDLTLDLDPNTVHLNMSRDYYKIWGEPGSPDFGRVKEFVLKSESFSLSGQAIIKPEAFKSSWNDADSARLKAQLQSGSMELGGLIKPEGSLDLTEVSFTDRNLNGDSFPKGT
jgi:hypothetical protein